MEPRQFKKPNLDNFLVKAWKLRKRWKHVPTVKVLGSTPSPVAQNWLTRLLIQIGNTCTAYTSVAIREAEIQGAQFDPAKQWSSEVLMSGGQSDEDGVTADVMMNTGVKIGFYREGAATPSDPEKAWFTVTPTFSTDLFDMMKDALQIAPLAVSLNWYSDWDFATGPVPHTFNTLLGGHETKAFTVYLAIVNGVECIALQGSWGSGYGNNGCFYFDRYMTNKAFSDVRYWSSAPQDIVRMNFLLALLTQVAALYHELIAQKNGYPPPTPISKIQQWANAIAKAENAKSSLNNPGDLKMSSLTASWGATQGFQATDGGWIAKFATYEQGMSALCNFLRLGCSDELVAFHAPESRTLGGFMKIYAGNPPEAYLNGIAAALGVSLDINITTFLG
jgi:hypothetical protein